MEMNLIQNYLIYYQQSPNFTHTFWTSASSTNHNQIIIVP